MKAKLSYVAARILAMAALALPVIVAVAVAVALLAADAGSAHALPGKWL